ncbi:unnamed protein product, partial [Mesorhabditis belari]|uniref:Glutathione S-transferase n=1 Tax=Mesorhabditis belari TaxID=2138241 RepID=A0AAF3F7U9_9BILA
MSSLDLELISLPGRGRAESLRLMLIFASKQFTDTRMTIQEWKLSRKKASLDEKTKLPVLIVDNGRKTIVGAVEIGRYIALNFHLYGSSSSEQEEINQVIRQAEILNLELAPIIRTTLTKNYDLRREIWNEYKERTMNPIFEKWENELRKKTTMVGNKYTWADICVVELLTRFQCCYDSFFLASWPALKNLVERFEDLPNVRPYLQTRPDTNF